MLVDMHQGSLAVYKNGERLGLMVRSGLMAPLRWCASATFLGAVPDMKTAALEWL